MDKEQYYKIELLGRRTVYGQSDIENAKKNGEGSFQVVTPYIGEDAAHKGHASVKHIFGWGALYASEPCTKEDALAFYHDARDLKPFECSYEYLSALGWDNERADRLIAILGQEWQGHTKGANIQKWNIRNLYNKLGNSKPDEKWIRESFTGTEDEDVPF